MPSLFRQGSPLKQVSRQVSKQVPHSINKGPKAGYEQQVLGQRNKKTRLRGRGPNSQTNLLRIKISRQLGHDDDDNDEDDVDDEEDEDNANNNNK